MAIILDGVTIDGGALFEGVAAASPSGQQAYTTAGTFSWTAPAGVTSVCVVCVGGGAVRIIWGTGRAFPSTNTGNL